MNTISALKHTLEKHQDFQKLEKLPGFFQAFEGGYGEGDRFMGVSVPNMRLVARDFMSRVSDEELTELLHDPIHEVRLTAVFILVKKFERSGSDQHNYVRIYLDNLEGINNWDLVDSSAYKILGIWLRDKDRSVLYKLAESGNLWKERIAMVSTMAFIRRMDFRDTFQLSEYFLNHPHDLIHKAVGWMLKEVGKKDQEAEEGFLRVHYKKMPRTMLRYAIEKFEESLRKDYLEGRI